jgi:tetratricopeptide (TPR) repeat protein
MWKQSSTTGRYRVPADYPKTRRLSELGDVQSGPLSNKATNPMITVRLSWLPKLVLGSIAKCVAHITLPMCLVLLIPFIADHAATCVQADEPSALPVVPTDEVVVRKEGSRRTQTVRGVIEDMSGQSIVLRRPGSTIDVFRLREVVSVRFQKSAEFDDGLRKLAAKDWNGALTALRSAAAIEPRKWAVREIQASMAQAQRALGQYEDCLKTLEEILAEDPDSRHAVELPIVWDERLPAEHRIQLTATELQSASRARQLTAASSLLHVAEHQAAAIATLQSLRKSTRGVLQDLAETQLWRIRLLNTTEPLRESEVEQWSQRVRFLDRRTRSGPEFLIGRALLKLHDYDLAATSLLWMPLMEPLDPPTTKASLTDAINALNLSGRTVEAARLETELKLWSQP